MQPMATGVATTITNLSNDQVQLRKVSVPPNRLKPLKKAWSKIFTAICDTLNIDVRMNLKTCKVELKTKADTSDAGNLQKSVDFVHAFILGFDIEDASRILKEDDFYVESFEINGLNEVSRERLLNVKDDAMLAIENETGTRIVTDVPRFRILGTRDSIKEARNAVCNLILGSPAVRGFSRL